MFQISTRFFTLLLKVSDNIIKHVFRIFDSSLEQRGQNIICTSTTIASISKLRESSLAPAA